MKFSLCPLGGKAIRILAIVSIALPVMAGAALGLTVQTAHPRLFFDADSLTALRARFGTNGPGRQLFVSYKSWVDNYFNAGDSNIIYAPEYAAVYLLTQDTRYAQKAISIAMTAVQNGVELENEGSGPCRSSAVACVYDWCYDQMTSAQRGAVRRAFYQHLSWDGRAQRTWQMKDSGWHYRMAVAGDYASADSNSAVLAKLQESVSWLDQGFLPCIDKLRGAGGWDGYGTKVYFMLLFRDCLLHATNYSGPDVNSAFIQNTPAFLLHELRPDYGILRTPGKYNPQMPLPAMTALMASRFNNAYMQTVTNSMLAQQVDWRGNGLLLMIYYVPGMATASLSGLPKEYYEPNMGMVFMRNGWNMGSTSSDVMVSFFNTPDTEYGEGRAQNHFVLSRGADNLIIDSGRFGRDDDEGFSAYYINTIAHNTVLIYDPAEPHGSMTNGYGHTIPMPNDGGQDRFDMTCGGAGNSWPECEEGTNPGVACRGEITKCVLGDAATVIESDATASYSQAKAGKVVRKFSYLHLNQMAHPDWILVQDKVVLNKPNLPVRVVFHCVDRPSVDGTLTALQGVLTQGGVFQSLNTSRITIDKGNSSARIYVLQATGGSSEVRLVGGPSRNGLYWKQNIEANDGYSYVSNIADQSYEFYVDGKNYPPGGRDETYMRDHRNDPGADVAGDWRIEHLIQNAPSEVRTAYLINVTGRTDPVATVVPQVLADGSIQVTVTDAGQTFSFGICPPEQQCTGMNW